jgi:hypothetical protein
MGREIFPSTAKRCYINSAGNNKRLFSQMKKRLPKESQLPIQINEAKIMGQHRIMGIAVRLDYIISDVLGKNFIPNQIPQTTISFYVISKSVENRQDINQRMNSNNLLQKYSILH